MPRLILLNGAPGSGKSTLARRWVDGHPLALLLDIDSLRGNLGRWSDDPMEAGLTARRLGLALIDTQLRAGLDVIVPQFLARPDFADALAAAARAACAEYAELALTSSPEEAEARFAARSASDDPNHRDARLLQSAPGAAPIAELYAAMMRMIDARPHVRCVESVPGDIDGTFERLTAALET